MKPERWQAIDRIFASALTLPPDGRAALLDEACGGDLDMRREIEELLEAEKASAGFLSTSLGEVAMADAFSGEATYEAGHRIGPYELLRPVGQGGMSTVYLATRADGHYRREVAIKLIRRGFESAQILHRFRMERQILAGLEHPSIARLYDGGTTEEGFPFLVMEYIEGLPLDRFCDQHKQTIDQRLTLFREVCLAVEHAHRNLLVHRDLKPSNILVTNSGEIKLLDFGIAKLLTDQADGVQPHPGAASQVSADGPDLTAFGAVDARALVEAETLPAPREDSDLSLREAAAGTATGVRPMTPGYASPEQVRGEAVTPATDIYALGVVLYWLLAGASPYDAAIRSQAELERAILKGRIVPPSAALSRGEEEGASADPDAGVQAAAMRGTKPDALRKRLRGELDAITLKALRNRPADRYGSALALAEDLERHRQRLPVSAVPKTAGYRLRRFVQRNALAASAAGVVAALLIALTAVTLFQAARVTRERNLARQERERAQTVSDFLMGIFAQADPDESHGQDLTVRQVLDRSEESLEELSDQPERQALYSFTIAGIYRTMGELAKAAELYERALALRIGIHGEDHMEVATVFDELAVTYQRQGNYDAAEPPMRRAFEIREKLIGRESNEILPSLNNLGLLLYYKGDYEQANALLEETARRVEESEGLISSAAAITRSNYALSLHETGDYEAAEVLYREALAINLELHGEEHSHVAISLHNLASLMADKDLYEEAEETFRKALAMRQKLLGEEHPRVVATMTGLAEVVYQRRRFDESQELFERAVAIGRKALGNDHWRLGNALTGLARLLLATDRVEDAVPRVQEALVIYRAKLPVGHIRTAYAEAVLGGCFSELGRVQEAEALLLRAHPILRDRLTDHEPMTRDARALLVAHFGRVGQPERADPDR